MKLKLVCDEDNHMELTSEIDLPKSVKSYKWNLECKLLVEIDSY